MQLAVLELDRRLHHGPVLDDVEERQVLVAGVHRHVLERQDDRTEEPLTERVELLTGHTERRGGLVGRRRTAETGREVVLDGVELTGQQPDRAGGPVGGPDGVDDGATDALGGEPVERHSAGVLEPAGRLDQTERPGAGQLVTVDVAGEVHRHLEDHVVHEVQMVLDQRRNLGRSPGGRDILSRAVGAADLALGPWSLGGAVRVAHVDSLSSPSPIGSGGIGTRALAT